MPISQKNKTVEKTTIFIITIGFLVVLSLLFSTNPSRLFKAHVLSQSSRTILVLNHYRDRCAMHGPLVFVFNANQEDIQNIIKENGLAKYEKIPEFAYTLLKHIDGHNLSWWKKANNYKTMSIYGRESNENSEPHIKFIFTDDTNIIYYLQA